MAKRKTAAASSRRRPPRLQVAALCWRLTKNGKLRILLITSRDTGRWVIPKGWTMHNRTDAEAAEREAWEEAGVKGRLGTKRIGYYRYRKTLLGGGFVPVTVKVFPLKVKARLKSYPETGERRSIWASPKKAAKRVREPELKALIARFDPGDL